MATIKVEVDDDVIPWLQALAIVRGVEVPELVATGLRHLRVTPTEKERVTYYRSWRRRAARTSIKAAETAPACHFPVGE